MKIKLMIIEDNILLRQGISAMLKQEHDIRVVAALSDRVKADDKIAALKPGVLLLDLGLVYRNSLKLVMALKLKFPRLGIVGMGLLPVPAEVKEYLKAGISGFMEKDAPVKEFMSLIRACARGKQVTPSQDEASVLSEIIRNYSGTQAEDISMTVKEKKIMKLLTKGNTNKEIASIMSLSNEAIKAQIHNILEKMALTTRVEYGVN